VNLAFAQRALELTLPTEPQQILDMGTGTARIPILILQHAHHDIRICAIDLSKEMLNVARKNVAAAGLEDRLTLQLVDAKGLPFENGSFDMVVSNSLAHHIPDPSTFFNEAARVVRSGGGVFIRDLMRPDSVAEVNLVVEKYAGDADEYQRKLYRDSLCAALTIPEVEGFLRKAGIADARVVQSSDRHWSVERAVERR
jgi:ubiquinone/menaquinone biosynthesis C-methylase UbiE